ncbi:uncharacterized protein LOC123626265 [Lemur catta]|uniref:uncharacterized protein LOC123626265 n=1 Tax=Lemur catta TaxID=9447 RepID=UPI001E269DF6|nr:uncharacterized protein LOC123626265 [Lemur catta]
MPDVLRKRGTYKSHMGEGLLLPAKKSPLAPSDGAGKALGTPGHGREGGTQAIGDGHPWPAGREGAGGPHPESCLGCPTGPAQPRHLRGHRKQQGWFKFLVCCPARQLPGLRIHRPLPGGRPGPPPTHQAAGVCRPPRLHPLPPSPVTDRRSPAHQASMRRISLSIADELPWKTTVETEREEEQNTPGLQPAVQSCNRARCVGGGHARGSISTFWATGTGAGLVLLRSAGARPQGEASFWLQPRGSAT